MNNHKYRFSVFTATYNRAHLLQNVFNDLEAQTFQDFEWVVVNDGSSDNTDEVMNNLIKQATFPVKYITKENGGKHTAWKEATKVFEGRYIVGADDDDQIPSNVLEIFNREWEILEMSSNYDDFWEIRSRVVRENGKLMGPSLPTPYFDSNYNEVNYKMKFGGIEMGGCRKVEVLRAEASVPDTFYFQNKVSNFSEGIRWSRAARKYKTRFIPDVTRTYVVAQGESLCRAEKDNKGKVVRSERRSYNTLVGSLYTIREQKDLMLKYWPTKYIKECAVCLTNAFRLKLDYTKLPINLSDKIMMTFLYIPTFIILKYRG